MKRNLVHRSSVSGADSGSAVFQARCLSRNTSIFTWISSEISSSFSGWELVEGARGQGVAVAWGWERCTAGQSRPRGWPREATAQAENNGARAEPWAPQAFLHPQASSPGPLQVSVTAPAPRCPSAHQLHDPPRLKPPTMSTCLYNLTTQGHNTSRAPTEPPQRWAALTCGCSFILGLPVDARRLPAALSSPADQPAKWLAGSWGSALWQAIRPQTKACEMS